MIAIGMLGVHVIIYIICRVIIESQTVTNEPTKIFVVLALAIKLISDFYVFWVFTLVFKYFLTKKRQSLSKEALSLSPLNIFIIIVVCFMFLMRVLGTLFNT
jgi:hypothetical protein